MEHLNPRGARVVALSAPSERERGQWYFQRYVAHLPTGGEIVLFDRSWYTRAVVERVMGFCTDDEYEQFMAQVPEFERMLVASGIHLVKLWFSVARTEQLARFTIRRIDPVRQWKLSPMDLASLDKWEEYSSAKEAMFLRTDTDHARWTVVRSNDKKRGRLEAMRFVLANLDYPDKDHNVLGRPRPAHRRTPRRRRCRSRRAPPSGRRPRSSSSWRCWSGPTVIVEEAVYEGGRRSGTAVTLESISVRHGEPDTFAWVALRMPPADELWQWCEAFGWEDADCDELVAAHDRPVLSVTGERLELVLRTALGADPADHSHGHVRLVTSTVRSPTQRRSSTPMTISHGSTERELKLQIDPSFELPGFEGFEQLSSQNVELVATYWDTSERALTRRGHTLRYRTASDGSEQSWTLKLSEHGSKFAQRREVDAAGDPLLPPTQLVEVVRGLIGHAPLDAVATLTTRRRTAVFRRPEDGTTIEVADDRVTSRVGSQEGPSFREVEVELLEGDEAVLDEAAVLLAGAGAAGDPDATPKLLRVLGTGPDAEPLSRKPRTVGELVAGAIAQATAQLLAHDPAIRLDGKPEDIHKARVATRRLRSDLKSLEVWCDPFRVTGLRQEVQWFGELLGRVRDADVLPATIAARGEQLTDLDGAAVAGIVELLAEDRRQALAVLLDVMGSGRYLGLLGDLERLSTQPPLRAGVDPAVPAKPAGRKSLARAVGRVATRVDRLPTHAGLEPLHEVRKAVKRARYAAELMSGLSNGRTDVAAERLAALQDELGALQDAVAANWWLSHRSWAEVPPVVAFTAGRLAQSFAAELTTPPTGWHHAWHRATARSARRWFD